MKNLKLSVVALLFVMAVFFTPSFAQTADSDGDGVNDSEDLCPGEKGTKANKGCAEQTKKTEQTQNVSVSEADLLKLQVAYVEEIGARDSKYKKSSEQYSTKASVKLRRENLESRKSEMTAIKQITTKVLADYGNKISASNKKFFTERLEDAEYKLKLINTQLELVALDEKGSDTGLGNDFLDKVLTDSKPQVKPETKSQTAIKTVSVSAQIDNPEMGKEVEAAIKAFVEKNRSQIIEKATAAILDTKNSFSSSFAVTALTQLLNVTPNDAEALRLRGVASNSKIDFINTIQLDNRNASAKYNLAMLLSGWGYVDEAEKYFKAALEGVTVPQYRLKRGKNALLVGNYQACIESLQGLEDVQEISWAKKEIYLTIAECYAESGNKQAAKTNFEKAISMQEGLKGAYSYRLFNDNVNGCKSTAEKNYQDASKNYDNSDKRYETFRSLYTALKCDPNHLPSLKLLYKFEDDDKNSVMQTWAKVHQIRIAKLENPNQPPIDIISEGDKADTLDSFNKNAQSSFEKKDNDAVINYANEVLRFDPNNAEALVMRARGFFNHKNESLNIIAWRDASKALQLSPNIERVRNIRGLLYLDVKKDTAAAITEFTKGIETNPKEYRLYNNRGRAFARLKDYVASNKEFDSVIQIIPTFQEAYILKGMNLYNTKDYKNAIVLLEKAVEINAKNANAHYWLIVASDALGDKTKGDTHHAWMLKNAPNDSRLKELVSRNPQLVNDIVAETNQTKRNETIKNFVSLWNQREENISKIQEQLTSSQETYKKDYDRKAHLSRAVNYLDKSLTDLKRILFYAEKRYTEEGSILDAENKQKTVENIRVLKEDIIKRQKEYDAAFQIYRSL